MNTEELKRMVKSYVVAKGYTFDKLAKELNKRYSLNESRANLSNKLKRGTLRYIELVQILDVLGYSIEIKNNA
jgi:hypothetical protein